MPIVLNSGSFDLLETSGPVQVCNGIALTLNTVKSVLVEIVRILLSNVKVKQSRYRPGVAQRVPGS